MKNLADDCKPTPLTDAAIERVNVSFVGHDGLSSYEADYVSPDFARDLERKLAAAEERIEELEKRGQTVCDLLSGYAVNESNDEQALSAISAFYAAQSN